jgi:F-type H+-transporting ATPase subunit epsilon
MAIPPIPSQLTLEIVTPDHAVAHAEVDEVEIPGENGYIGVLPGHTPLLTSLKVGEMWYRKGGERHFLSVAFGFAEVLPDRVIVLARMAEKAEDIDVARAEAARRRAEERLAQAKGVGAGRVDQDLDRARVALMKAMVRLNVATRARTRG